MAALAPLETRPQTAGDVVATALEAEGVEVAFGLVGSHILGLYDSLRRQSRLRHVTIRHETNAGFMAHAYAVLSGKVPVLLTTAGPGVLNALGAIGHCYFQSVPLVMISGGVPTHGVREDVHGGRTRDFTTAAVAPVAKAAFRAESVAALPGLLAEAFRLATSGRPGPVYVEIPWNLSHPAPWAAPLYRRAAATPSMRCPDSHAEYIASALSAAPRSVFCIDRGVVRRGLERRVVALAERIGAALVVSFDAIGAVPDDHPLYAGVANDFFFGTPAFDALQASKFALAIGLGRGTGNEDFFRRLAGGGHFCIYCDDSPAEYADGVACDLSSALDLLEARVVPRSGAPRWIPTSGREHRQACEREVAGLGGASPLHPGYVLSRVARHVTGEMTVCLDVGANEVWAHSLLPVAGVHSQIGASNWAGMGGAMPALVGAQLARPGAPRLGVCGDGGLLMALGEYRTLLEAGGRCVLLVINDCAFGIIERFQRDAFGAGFGTALGATDFAAIAASFGGRGLRVETASDLEDALDEAFEAAEVVLVDVRTAAGEPFPPILHSPALTG